MDGYYNLARHCEGHAKHFTAHCLRRPIQMAGVETILELHTLATKVCFSLFDG